MVVKVFFVIVLYKQKIAESRACSTLMLARVHPRLKLFGLIFDNTPGERQENAFLDHDIEYVARGNNLGLPAAYNYAIQRAALHSCEFIMLLDQDSSVTNQYLDAAADALESRHLGQVAWVPTVRSNERIVSPYRLTSLGNPVFGFDPDRANPEWFAINSFSILSLRYLNELGGFDPHYWLDALDSWLYSTIAKHGRQVGNVNAIVPHQLSLVEGGTPSWRLVNIANFETCFRWECLSPLQAFVGTLRVLVRGLFNFRALAASGMGFAYLTSVWRGACKGVSRR